MRLSATASFMERKDVIIIASVSCIYGLGNPTNFKGMGFPLAEKMSISRTEVLKKLLEAQYERNDLELIPGRFRVKGDNIDVIPGYDKDILRIELFGSQIDRLHILDKITGALAETKRRREIQQAHNKKYNIQPQTIKKPIEEQMIIIKDTKHIPKKEKEKTIPQLEKEMREAAEALDFELAIALRDQLTALQAKLGIKQEVPLE